MSSTAPTLEQLIKAGQDCLPGHLGVRITRVDNGEVDAELDVLPHLLAPNGYLHAGAIITLADTAAGYACMTNLPEGANSFTTIEIKSNHLGTARDGTIRCTAKAAHVGRTTQVWQIDLRNEAGQMTCVSRITMAMLAPA